MTLRSAIAPNEIASGRVSKHFVDKGYMSVDHLIQAQQDYDITLMGAVPDDNSWQARKQGYDSRQFAIDWLNDVPRAVTPTSQFARLAA